LTPQRGLTLKSIYLRLIFRYNHQLRGWLTINARASRFATAMLHRNN